MVKGRPEKLTENLKREIARIRINHPKWRLAEIREELRPVLTKTIKKEQPAWNDKQVNLEVVERLPGISRIQKFIKKDLKPNEDKPEIQNLEKPWHLGRLEQYPLPPEAIPYIILVQHVAGQYPELVTITIRQAQWIARFYGIFGDYQRLKDKDKLEVAGGLYELAKAYADHEIICYLSGTPPDTSELDKDLREGRIPKVSIPIVVGYQHVILNRDFTFKVDSKTAKQIENSQKEGEK